MIKRLLLIVLILAAIAGGIAYTLLDREKAIVLTGVVTTDDVIANAQVSGRLEKLCVKQGDIVKQGDLLAVIQPAQWQADKDYYANLQKAAATQVDRSTAQLRFEELQSKNQIAQAQANLAAAEAQVTQAEAQLENDRLTFQREQDLFNRKVESQQAFDQARTTYDGSQAHVAALNKAVLSAKAAVALAQSTTEQVAMSKAATQADRDQLAATAAQLNKANVELGYTEIRAPIGGIVDVRAAREGEVVNPGQAIVTLINPDDLWVRADVEETYIDSIHLGDKMQVRLPSGEVRTGTVFYRSVDADYATQRDVSRTKRDIKTFEIRLRCDNSDRALALGMTAYVTLPLERSGQSPVVSGQKTTDQRPPTTDH